MQPSKFWLLLTAAVLFGSMRAAHADGPYVVGSIGHSNVSFDASGLYASSNSIAYQVGVGYRAFGVLAGEIDYVGFPRAYSGINYVDTYGIGASVLGFLPIPVVDVYGRFGLFGARTNAYTALASFNHTGSDLTYGAGVGMHWGNIGGRVEYEAFDVAHANKMNVISLGVMWSLF